MGIRLILLATTMLPMLAGGSAGIYAADATASPTQSSRTASAKQPSDLGDTAAIEDLMRLIPEERSGAGNRTSSPPVAGLGLEDTKRNTTLAVQKWLKALGCYRGEIDGLWGPGSQRALDAAIGASDAVAGATATNLSKIEAVAHKDVCKDLPPRVTVSQSPPAKTAAAKAARTKPRGCMSYSACMAGCADGTVGRGVGAICTFVCGSEVPVCPQ